MRKCEARNSAADLLRLEGRIAGVMRSLDAIRDEIGYVDAGPDVDKDVEEIKEGLEWASIQLRETVRIAGLLAGNALDFAVYLADEDDE